MSMESPGFGARLALAFKVLFNAALAGRLARLLGGAALPEPEVKPEVKPEAPPEPKPVVAAPDATAALQLLAILQREGRLIDFLQEEAAAFSDADIGAAARVVHAGCKKSLAEYFDIAVVRTEAEGAPIVLTPGFDATRNRVTGNVVGEPPYRGRLAHPGWQVTAHRLPAVAPGHDARIIAPAEIEL